MSAKPKTPAKPSRFWERKRGRPTATQREWRNFTATNRTILGALFTALVLRPVLLVGGGLLGIIGGLLMAAASIGLTFIVGVLVVMLIKSLGA